MVGATLRLLAFLLAFPFNDPNRNFGPPFGDPLPSAGVQALQYQGVASDNSTSNVDDYALTAGAAVFTNNAGDSFTVTP